MEFVPFPYFSREPQPAGRYYRGKVRYFYRGVEVGDAVGPSTRNFARAAGWARARLARDGDVVRGEKVVMTIEMAIPGDDGPGRSNISS